jgi:hypothetical protein
LLSKNGFWTQADSEIESENSLGDVRYAIDLSNASSTDSHIEAAGIVNPFMTGNGTFISTNDSSLVQNTMLHYGSFCGPGPRLLPTCLAPLDPVDEVDTICMRHDLGWCRCFEDNLPPYKPHPLILSTRFITMPAPM